MTDTQTMFGRVKAAVGTYRLYDYLPPCGIINSSTWENFGSGLTFSEARAECDRLNALAVLEAMRDAGDDFIDAQWDYFNPKESWRELLNAIIVEAKEPRT